MKTINEDTFIRQAHFRSFALVSKDPIEECMVQVKFQH